MKIFFAWLSFALLIIGCVDYFSFQFLTDTGDNVLIFYPFGLYIILCFTWKEVGFFHRVYEFILYLIVVFIILAVADYATFQILGKPVDTTIMGYSYAVGMICIALKSTFLSGRFQYEEIQEYEKFCVNILWEENCKVSIRWTPNIKCVLVEAPTGTNQYIKDKITLAFRDARINPMDYVVVEEKIPT
jgi:hypothetical protein